MVRPKSSYPTELELLILKVLWNSAPMPGREVQTELDAAGRRLARTSVITTLNTMVEKKYLKRKKQGNTFLFSPRITQEEVSHRVLGDVVNRVFDGATSTVLMKLFDRNDVDPGELREMRRLIDEKLKADEQTTDDS